MKSKTKIEKQVQKKTNSTLVATIIAAKKHKNWLPVAQILSGSRRNQVALNLSEIDELLKDLKEVGTIVVPGKVLSQGELSKKIKIVALNFSGKAKEKLDKEKTPSSSIIDEIKKNPEAKGVRVLTNKGAK